MRITPFALLAAAFLGACAQAPPEPEAGPVSPSERPVLIATWPFGKQATDLALETMQAGGSALDGVEAGIRLIETLGPDRSVGLRGQPNAAGYVQLDACIMDGPGQRAGSVAAVEGIVHPITAARLVMERSKHVMLVGEGARWFALEQGLESVDIAEDAELKRIWVEREVEPAEPRDPGHDTVTVLALDADGNLCGGCSTSGAGGKTPGRVGDSPILGAGLFVDNEVGAAGATGLGENVMRFSATATIVELMRQGLHPQAACEEMIHRMARVDPRGYELAVCFIALDKQGRYGAAASNQRFPFAVTTPTESSVQRVERVAVKGEQP